NPPSSRAPVRWTKATAIWWPSKTCWPKTGPTLCCLTRCASMKARSRGCRWNCACAADCMATGCPRPCCRNARWPDRGAHDAAIARGALACAATWAEAFSARQVARRGGLRPIRDILGGGLSGPLVQIAKACPMTDDPLALRHDHAFDIRLNFDRRWSTGPVYGGAQIGYTS